MSTKDKPKPTAEQIDCIEKFLTGKPLVVNAYAGCGKTTGGIMMSEATRRPGTYLAFGKDIAKDAATKFPSNVACSTVHSLAYRALVGTFGRDKMSGSINGGFLAEKLRLQSRSAGDLTITPRGWGFLISQTLKKFQSSDRDQIGPYDVVFEGKLATLDARMRTQLADALVKEANGAWEQMQDRRSPMPLGHDGYLKVWALSRPVIPGDFIFVDEAQDTNPVVLGIVRHQQAQIVAVGDRHQQIYEWRGAVNAMALLPRELEARLSTSWRFGTAVAGYASKILELLGETVPLKGNPARPSRLTGIAEPNAILTRTNGRLLGELMAALDAGRKPYMVGGVDEMKRWLTATDKLMAYQSVEMPLEFFGFKSWQEVRETSEREDGAELRRWVKTVDDYGTESLRRALDSLPSREDQADLVLSTGHKAKGREWERVRLCDDFLRGVRTEAENAEKKPLDTLQPDASPDAELRLYYVAATRAQVELDVPATLAEKLDVLCIKAGVTPPPDFAPLTVTAAPPAPNSAIASPDGAEDLPPWHDDYVPALAEGPAQPKPKAKRAKITKRERETLIELLRDKAADIPQGTAEHAHFASLLSKMEAMNASQ